MKNSKTKNIVLVIATAIMLFAGFNSKAQVSCLQDWGVENNFGCIAQFEIRFYCNGAAAPCQSYAATIAPSSTLWFQWNPSIGANPGCSGSCNPCEVEIELQVLGPPCTTGLPIIVSSTNPSQTIGPCAVSCVDGAGTATLYWYDGMCTIGW